MKKIILALAILPLILNAADNEELQNDEAQVELVEAPQDFVLDLLYGCKQDAIEDEVTESEMNKYLLTCINDELEGIEYKKITALPKEDE